MLSFVHLFFISTDALPSVHAAPGVTVFPMQNQASPVRKANHFPATSPFVNQFQRKPTPAWVRPPPIHQDSFSYSPSSAHGMWWYIMYFGASLTRIHLRNTFRWSIFRFVSSESHTDKFDIN
jgi:hypothetical protein